MASWLDEVDASMYAIVHDVDTVDLVLRIEISIEALFNVLNYRAPRDVVVDEVAETRGINDGQTKAHAILFNVGADRLYGDGFGADVKARRLTLLRGVKRCVEESVDQSRLAEAGFT